VPNTPEAARRAYIPNSFIFYETLLQKNTEREYDSTTVWDSDVCEDLNSTWRLSHTASIAGKTFIGTIPTIYYPFLIDTKDGLTFCVIL
jgi:hypothetical protein